MNIMKGMTDKSRTVNGKPTSLCDLGYCDVGLDDNWQACGSKDAAPGMHYHDVKGNPLVNYQRCPDFKNMDRPFAKLVGARHSFQHVRKNISLASSSAAPSRPGGGGMFSKY